MSAAPQPAWQGVWHAPASIVALAALVGTPHALTQWPAHYQNAAAASFAKGITAGYVPDGYDSTKVQVSVTLIGDGFELRAAWMPPAA